MAGPNANPAKDKTTRVTAGGDSAPQVMGMAAQRYAQGSTDRQPFLDRARRCAKLTIPYLFRKEGDNSSTDTEVPWDSSGAYMVSNLAAKVILALFPPGRPPMKLKQAKIATDSLMNTDADASEKAELKAQIDAGLSLVEQEFVELFEEDADRARMGIAALKMIVGGNHGFQFYDDGSLRDFSLDRYVLWLDTAGNLLEFVIKDSLDYATLPPLVQAAATLNGFVHDASDPGKRNIDVFTWGRRMGNQFKLCQELQGQMVQGSDAVYNMDVMPYFFPMWNRLDNESYSRSYVENYEGDFQTVEGLTQTIVESSAAIASFVRMVSPTGLTSKKALAEAKNGDVITGRDEDVTTLISSKGGDLQTADKTIDKAQARLARAFLLNSAVQRGGERVTAEEIRFVAQELEDGLGGVYSQQVVTFQTPYIRLKMFYSQKQGRLTALPKGQVKVSIIAGMAALGRNAELANLDSFIGGAVQVFGAEQVFAALGPKAIRTYLYKRAAALGIDTTGLIPTAAEGEAMDTQAQQQQLVQQLGPEALKQIGQNQTATQVAGIQSEGRIQASQGLGVEVAATPEPIAVI
jgi:Bacteriophage head to tail connecting protein